MKVSFEIDGKTMAVAEAQMLLMSDGKDEEDLVRKASASCKEGEVTLSCDDMYVFGKDARDFMLSLALLAIAQRAKEG